MRPRRLAATSLPLRPHFTPTSDPLDPPRRRRDLWLIALRFLVALAALAALWSMGFPRSWPVASGGILASFVAFGTVLDLACCVDYPDRRCVAPASFLAPLAVSLIVSTAWAMVVAFVATAAVAAAAGNERRRTLAFQPAAMALATALGAHAGELVSTPLSQRYSSLARALPGAVDVRMLLFAVCFAVTFGVVANATEAAEERCAGGRLHTRHEALATLLFSPLSAVPAVGLGLGGPTFVVWMFAGLTGLLIVIRLWVNLRTLHRTVVEQAEELRVQNIQLEQARAFKRDVSQLIGHDIRQPIGIIMLAVESIQRSLSRGARGVEQTRERLARVEVGARAIRSLTEHLLALQQIDEAEIFLGATRVDTRQLLEDVVVAARDIAEYRHQAMTLSFVGTRFVIGTSEWVFREAVDNLISNAVKYTPEGGRIEIDAESTGDAVTVAVRDTGIGMSPEDLRRVFTKFFRSEEATRAAKGSGLGLALVRTMVEKVGGSIAVESTLGQGSTFVVTFPDRSPRPGVLERP